MDSYSGSQREVAPKLKSTRCCTSVRSLRLSTYVQRGAGGGQHPRCTRGPCRVKVCKRQHEMCGWDGAVSVECARRCLGRGPTQGQMRSSGHRCKGAEKVAWRRRRSAARRAQPASLRRPKGTPICGAAMHRTGRWAGEEAWQCLLALECALHPLSHAASSCSRNQINLALLNGSDAPFEASPAGGFRGRVAPRLERGGPGQCWVVGSGDSQ